MYKSFEEMPIWRQAMDLSGRVFMLSIDLPKSEDYGLTSQIRRASNSVNANIAEAFGRSSKKDKRNFYIHARASAFETKSHLLYGVHVNYFKVDVVDLLLKEYDILIYDMNKILKTLSIHIDAK